MNYNFTDRVRKVLAMAREQAMHLGHDYVGTEHMLLGLVKEGGGVAAAVLAELGADAFQIESRVRKSVREGNSTIGLGELPYTSRAKKVLEFSMAAAREMRHGYVGTEHLLLGLLREEKGIAAQVLNTFGITVNNAGASVRRLLDRSPLRAIGDGDGGDEVESRFSIEIDDTADVSIYEQIVARVREAVATGELAPGSRLPPVRRLADQLDIAPGTVARAYSELERVGVVVTEGARGTRVADRTAPSRPELSDPETLVGLLRPVVVAAFHMGAGHDDLQAALRKAMAGIYEGTDPD